VSGARVVLLALVAVAACTSTPPAPEETTSPPGATYVGNDTCTTCHDDEATSLAKTIHARALADASRPESERGCEACHGPGSVHAEEGGGKGVGGMRAFAPEDSAAARSRACLGCHAGGSRLHDFLSGGHALSRVACTDCHKMHGGGGHALLAAPPPSLCYGCHQDVQLTFAMTERHKVPEGVIGCLDCHEPHGSRNHAALRDDEDRLCATCHADVQGPFVFEHAGLLTEGCTRCHEPHGSVNRHLLVRQQVAQLCLECHTSTPRDHVQPAFRDCTRCHVAIHGSNTDPHFLAP
jgi:DmsE family decaheme c-type cytochrome